MGIFSIIIAVIILRALFRPWPRRPWFGGGFFMPHHRPPFDRGFGPGPRGFGPGPGGFGHGPGGHGPGGPGGRW